GFFGPGVEAPTRPERALVDLDATDDADELELDEDRVEEIDDLGALEAIDSELEEVLGKIREEEPNSDEPPDLSLATAADVPRPADLSGTVPELALQRDTRELDRNATVAPAATVLMSKAEDSGDPPPDTAPSALSFEAKEESSDSEADA